MNTKVFSSSSLLCLAYRQSNHSLINRSLSQSHHLYCKAPQNTPPPSTKISTNTEDVSKSDPSGQEISDWIKDIHKEDDRPRVPFRRQNYPDPLSRVIGILTDDVRLFFGFYYRGAKEIWQAISSIKLEYKEESKLMKNIKSSLNLGAKEKNASTLPEDKVQNIATPEEKKKNEFLQSASSSGNKDTSSKKNKLNFLQKIKYGKPESWPSDVDFLVVGGGAIGSSIAYHLTKNAKDGVSVVVVDKDLTYKNSSTALSVGGIRHQFSVPENILLSMYGMQFMRELPRLLKVPNADPPCVNFQPHGYLTLASESGFEQLHENYEIQKHFNARVKMLDVQQIKERFPWMNTDGLAAGVLGVEGEGWFDPWSLLMALRRKAVHLGAQYIEAEVVDVKFKEAHEMISYLDGHPTNADLCINQVSVRLPNQEVRTIAPAYVIMAAGHSSGSLCYDLMGVGKAEEGLMAYPVPIEPRKRYVYCFHAPKGPGLATPLVVDPSRAYFRREGFGNMFLAGMSPTEEEEPPCDNLEVDDEFFLHRVWPAIAHRVPGFQEIKVQGSWSGFYEYNVFDQNGIVGFHPKIDNLFLASGFSGHGIQHAVGVGRAVMERLVHSEYRSIDMGRFEINRIYLNEPIHEQCIV